jgi:hypothetical protein
MPNLINPLLKLTKSQRDRLLERIVMRQSGKSSISPEIMDPGFKQVGEYRANVGGLAKDVPTIAGPEGRMTQSPLDQLMQQEPNATRDYGRLRNLGREKAIETYPWPEAKLRFLRDTEGTYEPMNAAIPTAKRLRGAVPGAPNDVTEGFADENMKSLARGLAYERMRFKPIQNLTERLATDTRGVEEGANTFGAMAPPDTQKKLMVDEARQRASMLAEMWKAFGGSKNVLRTQWKILHKGSRTSSRIKDPKDYFLSLGTHWLENPELVAQKHPREALILKELFNRIKE